MIFETTVYPNPDKNEVKERMIDTFQNGGVPIFAMQDNNQKKISATERLAKYKSELQVCGIDNKGQKFTNNFTDGLFRLNPEDIEHLIDGLGKRYPCYCGWIAITQEPEKFKSSFPEGYGSLNQNSFLLSETFALNYQPWNGVVAISTKIFNENVKLDVEVDRNSQNKKSWKYYHLLIENLGRNKQLNNIFQPVYERLKKESIQLYRDFDEIHNHENNGQRVNLSSIVKKVYKKKGFKYNKEISQQKNTILDKITPNGNILRITADSGGFNVLLPGIVIQIIGSEFISKEFSLLPSNTSIETVDQGISLLTHNLAVLDIFEETIISSMDKEMGTLNEIEMMIIKTHGIRKYIYDN